jgi:hypothetical protein
VSPATPGTNGSPKVELRFEPIEGVKINRYPKIKVHIPLQDGVPHASDAFIGDDYPPAGDQPLAATNYFKEEPTVSLPLPLSPDVAAGTHEFIGKTSFSYCVPASNFCKLYKGVFKIPYTTQ